MDNLFRQRTLIEIADQAHRLSGLISIKHPDEARRAVFALNMLKVQDISEEAKSYIHSATLTANTLLRGCLMLDAFWLSHPISLPPEKARLLVNAPKCLTLNDESNYRLDQLSTVAVSQVKGEFTGFFTNITLFAEHGFSPESVLDRVLPGSTITLARPNLETHSFWVIWSELDLSFGNFMNATAKRFKVEPLHRGKTDHSETLTFGLEAL